MTTRLMARLERLLTHRSWPVQVHLDEQNRLLPHLAIWQDQQGSKTFTEGSHFVISVLAGSVATVFQLGIVGSALFESAKTRRVCRCIACSTRPEGIKRKTERRFREKRLPVCKFELKPSVAYGHDSRPLNVNGPKTQVMWPVFKLAVVWTGWPKFPRVFAIKTAPWSLISSPESIPRWAK